jgi:penicillin-binding protein activator
MKNLIKSILSRGILLSVCSCGMFSTPTASYVDPNAVNNLTTNFTMTDLQMVSQSMADSLITSGKINSCKTYTVSKVVNKTDQYIDTETITQSIVNKLGNSNAVKARYVISSSEMQNQVDELDRQNQTGLYKPSTTAKVGKMKGAECRIDGFVNSIDTANSETKTHLVQYQYNMKLINVEAGEMVWSNEKPLSKMKQY